MKAGNCWACYYFAPFKDNIEVHIERLKGHFSDVGNGWCHRYPKSVLVNGDAHWCGEFQGLDRMERSPSNYA